jgi:fused signal recognition particle receptor
MTDVSTAGEKQGWLKRLRAGLSRSTQRIGESLNGLFTKRRLDGALLDELEDALVSADLGPSTAARLVRSLAKTSFDKEVDVEHVKRAFAVEIAAILQPVAKPFTIGQERPHVVLVVGVNGSGKTTTIGKMAKAERDRGHTIMLAACDTFRAAAVEQLKIWGERARVEVVARDGAEASGLAYEALEKAKRDGAELLFIDTAGRLQNKKDLMAELQKTIRVLRKLDPGAPHQCLLVLDATTGQNAHSQVEVFKDMCDVTGLIVTKLDGSAKGGVLVALAESFGLPVVAIGVGEGVDDLRSFDADAYANSLMGI